MNEEQLKEFNPRELNDFINKTLLTQKKEVIELKDSMEVSNEFTALQNSFNETYTNISNITKLLKVKTDISSFSKNLQQEDCFCEVDKPSLLLFNQFNSIVKTLAEHLEKLDLSTPEPEDDTDGGKTKAKGKTSKLKRLRAKARAAARKPLKALSSAFKGPKGAIRGLGVAGAGLDIYGRYEEGQSATQIAAGVGSGIVGAEAGAIAGAAIGTAILPVGGTIVGGLIGGAVGYYGGSALGDYGYNAATQPDATKVEESYTDKFADYVNETFTGVSNWFDSFNWFDGEKKEQQPLDLTALAVGMSAQSQYAPLSAVFADKKHKVQSWESDADFIKELNKVSFNFGINPKDLLGVMQVESGVKSDEVNKAGGAVGLIQFMPDTAKRLGTTSSELQQMTRAQQMYYVEKYFKSVGLRKGSTAAQIYAKIFLPGRANQEVLTTSNEKYYKGNVGLDINKDGMITQSELEQRVDKGKKALDLDKISSALDNSIITTNSLDMQIQKKTKEKQKIVVIIDKAGSVNSNFSQSLSPKPAPKAQPKQGAADQYNRYFGLNK